MGIQVAQYYLLHNLLFVDDQVIITRDNDNAAYLTRELMEERKQKRKEERKKKHIKTKKTENLTTRLDNEVKIGE